MTEKVEYSELEDGTQQIAVTNGNVLNSIVQWQPEQTGEMIYGITVSSDTPEEDFRKVRKYVDSFIKQATVSNKAYLNRKLTVVGCMMQPVKLKFRPGQGRTQTVDEQGRLIDYDDRYRQIIKVSHVDGKKLPAPIFLAFVSTAMEEEFINTWIPRYGQGDWNEPLDVVIEGVTTNSGGNTFNVSYV